MNDYSTTLSGTPVQVVPACTASGRNLLMLSAPGAANASGGSGDVIWSFTVTGSALVPGAPGTFLLQGGQTVQFGGGPTALNAGFVPRNAVWAVAARGSSAAITALANDFG